MPTDSEQHRPSFRFRDKLSRLKDKLKDKAVKHNVALFAHQNFTSNDTVDDYSQTTRHGFRQHMHHFKDVLKNKTHYESIKHKIKDKIDDKLDLHDNKTYPKGFYDSLFSPETENDVYLQTALGCLWVIAVLCIIPTIIVIFLPAGKKTGKATSTNMIFFHVFFCELCYLTYVLLAMINVVKDFRLGSMWCDIANYGMYVTIPIMQFALLFLSLERLTKHFNLSMTWAKIFTKPYLIQVILCAIWIFLVALLLTFMFIKKQFSFSFVKDQIKSFAPPIIGDVATKLASRRHHCSVDGRLSSVFKTAIIILFIVLIVKPIILSIGFNLLSPFCCRGRRKSQEKHGDRRTTNLVTIFLVLNLFFSFPFYFTSMFKSIFTSIDSTKDTFSIILKICFILRIINIIFECLAFYIFERNSWGLLSKVFYYCTCKKFPIFNTTDDNDALFTKDPKVSLSIDRIRKDTEDDQGRRKSKKKNEPATESEFDENEHDDDDDDGGFAIKPKKRSITEKKDAPVESEEEEEAPAIKPTKKRASKQPVERDEDKDTDGAFTARRKKQSITGEDDTLVESEEEAPVVKPAKKRLRKQIVEIDEDETQEMRKKKVKSKQKDVESGEEENIKTPKRRAQTKETESEDEEEIKVEITTPKRKSRPKKPTSDEEEHQKVIVSKRKPRPTTKEDDDDEEKAFIVKTKSKSQHHDVDVPKPNGTIIRKRKKSNEKQPRSTNTAPKRRSTPSTEKSASEASDSTKPRQRSDKPKGTRSQTKRPTTSANRTSKKSRHDSSKRPKKDYRARILQMSDDV